MLFYTLLITMLLGCRPSGAHTNAKDKVVNSDATSSTDNLKSFYSPSKALKKFAHKNPDCKLWSDWQSLCSYTGKNGSILCHDDPSMRVEPSEPFCTHVDLTKITEAQQYSLDRFCSLPLETNILTHPIQKKQACFGYLDGRPFSGKNLTSVSHDFCEAWITDLGWVVCDGFEDKVLKSGKRISNLKKYSCSEAISENIEFKYARCASWTSSQTQNCKNPVTYYDKPYLDYSDEENFRQIIPDSSFHLPLPNPVLGIACMD